MKKKILCLIIVAILLISSAASVSATDTGYGIWVGGVEVNASNAADVFGDGTVSYDAATNTLTLNNANITKCHYTEMFSTGVYAEIKDLTVNLVGENRITVPIHDNDMPDGSDVAVGSTKNIEISGTGKLWSNTYVIAGMQDVVIKNCEISSDWICVSSPNNVTVEDATISGKVGLINSLTGDITLKNTNVPDGGNYIGIYTETGDIIIDNCNVTIHSAVVDEDNTVPIAIGEGGGNFTVKNSVLDLKGNIYGILAPTSAAVFEKVSGKVEVAGFASYAMIFGGTVSMKDCDLEIVCRATDDAACGICTEQDIVIEDSKLKIDTRTTDEAALCIGNLESSNTNVNVLNSTLELTASGPNAAGFYANTVKLNDSITKIEATALATGKGFAAGIAALQGNARVNGGVLEVLATGPLEHEGPATVGILMGNAVLVPEFIGADVKLRGNQAICAYPDLSLYGREYELIASTDVSGETKIEFTKENIASVRYLRIHPYYTISFNGNGGKGEMFEAEGWYGEYTLPENTYEAPDGKKFKGWALSADGEILEGTSFIPNKDVTLFAIWENIETPPNDTDTETDTTPPAPNHTHSFGDEWKTNENKHYKECACGTKQYESEHTDSNENGSCDICGMQMSDKKDGIGIGAIIGIVIGVVVIIGIGSFALLWFIIKKKSFADLIAVFKNK